MLRLSARRDAVKDSSFRICSCTDYVVNGSGRANRIFHSTHAPRCNLLIRSDPYDFEIPIIIVFHDTRMDRNYIIFMFYMFCDRFVSRIVCACDMYMTVNLEI